jgi:hypothetical protein
VNLAEAESAYREALAQAGRALAGQEARLEAAQLTGNAAALLAEILATDAEELQTDALPTIVAPSAVALNFEVIAPNSFYGNVVPWSWWLSGEFYGGWHSVWTTEYQYDDAAWGYGGGDWDLPGYAHGPAAGSLGWASAYDAWGLYDPLAFYGVRCYAWGAWNPGYTGLVPQIPAADHKIDVLAEVRKFEQHVDAANNRAQATFNVVVASEDRGSVLFGM